MDKEDSFYFLGWTPNLFLPLCPACENQKAYNPNVRIYIIQPVPKNPSAIKPGMKIHCIHPDWFISCKRRADTAIPGIKIGIKRTRVATSIVSWDEPIKASKKPAIKKYINEIFAINPKITRLWITTWSWNTWMIKLSEKLWLKKEAVYRKARIVEWKYYDSISYWILRKEWDNI